MATGVGYPMPPKVRGCRNNQGLRRNNEGGSRAGPLPGASTGAGRIAPGLYRTRAKTRHEPRLAAQSRFPRGANARKRKNAPSRIKTGGASGCIAGGGLCDPGDGRKRKDDQERGGKPKRGDWMVKHHVLQGAH